jgi:hypothetical protein
LRPDFRAAARWALLAAGALAILAAGLFSGFLLDNPAMRRMGGSLSDVAKKRTLEQKRNQRQPCVACHTTISLYYSYRRVQFPEKQPQPFIWHSST